MLEIFKLLGTIAINNSEAIDAIDDTTDTAKKSQGKMSEAFKKIGSAVVAAFAVDKIKDFGVTLVETAANVKAMNSQFEQTFASLTDEASAAMERVASNSNILTSRLKGVGTSIYAFAKTTGMESAQALDLMERSLQITADSAAYYDRSLQDVSESLQSFLKGNYENDSALGLSCTETTRNAAANKLYAKTFNDLSESQKQLTLLQMVEDANKLSGAMGQAAREGSGWENVTGNLKASWDNFLAVVGTPVLEKVIPIIQNITNGVVKLTSTISSTNPVTSAFISKFEIIKNKLVSAGQYIANELQPILNYLKENWSQITESMSLAFEGMLDRYRTIWNSIGKPIWDIMKLCIDILLDAFKENMPQILAFFEEAIAGIKDTWENHLKPTLEAIGNFIDKVLKPVFEFVFSVWLVPFLKTVFSTIGNLWNNSLRPVFQGICDFITGVFTLDFKKAFTGLLSVCRGIWNGLVAIIQAPLDEAKNRVNSAVEYLKKKFDFKWSLPKIKLPHFSIKGKFSLDPPSIPKFKVEWYKAGAVLNSATIFGMNGNNPMVGGEAGPEAVAPISVLQGYVKDAVANSNAELVGIMEKILEILADYLPQAGNKQLVLDTGVLVGEIAEPMDTALGNILNRRKRGR